MTDEQKRIARIACAEATGWKFHKAGEVVPFSTPGAFVECEGCNYARKLGTFLDEKDCGCALTLMFDQWEKNGAWESEYGIPHVESDANAALMLCDWMAEKGWEPRGFMNRATKEWHWEFCDGKGKLFEATEKTLPLAIVNAFLAARADNSHINLT